MGEIWLFPKHTRIIRQLQNWWLQAQAKHIGVTSFAIGWAVLEIWTTCLPNCAKYTVKFGYFLNTLESSGQLLFWWLQAQGKHIGVTSFAIGWAVLEIWNTCLPNCSSYSKTSYSYISGEIWLFPKHTRIIRQLLFWWLQAQAKHVFELVLQ